MNTKIILLLAVIALLGGIVGSSFTAQTASAFNVSEWLQSFFSATDSRSDVSSDPDQTENNEKVVYLPAVDYEEKIMQAVEKSEPAVVSIVISKDVPIIEQCPYDPFGDLPDQFRQFFGNGFGFTQPCQKGTERREVGGGSGFIIREDGLTVTNKHVVADAKASYTVFTNDGKKHEATVIARDPVLDFAVLDIAGNNYPTLAIGDSDAARLGQSVIAIGNSLGEFRNTVSVGVVSGLRRNVSATDGGRVETIEGVIQTDAAINPGNSGGPLLNLHGQVIGISTAVATGAENIGFAIPINQVKRALKSIEATGKIVVPYLGVRYIVVDESRKESDKLPVDHGALVRGDKDGPAVVKGSPAEKAGILAEDIILEVGGEKIDATRSLGSLIQKYSVGDTIKLKVLRNGSEREIQVTLEERK